MSHILKNTLIISLSFLIGFLMFYIMITNIFVSLMFGSMVGMVTIAYTYINKIFKDNEEEISKKIKESTL